MNKYKLISIMAVYEEQNMIGLSITSTKDIVYQYIVIIKPGNDKTREVCEYFRDKFNLNMIIIESQLKLRYARKHCIDISKDYADYYLIQDGDEIYFTEGELISMGTKTIIQLMDEGYTHCETCMIYLKGSFLHTLINTTWLIPHPFLIKNIKDSIFFPNKGDLPYLELNKIWKNNIKTKFFSSKELPYKFDCNIKNFRRTFVRSMFTPWHDEDNCCTLDEYCLKNDERCKWYIKNIQNTDNLDEIIDYFKTNEDIYKFCKLYNQDEYFKYPNVIKKYIDNNMIFGLNNIDDLKLLN